MNQQTTNRRLPALGFLTFLFLSSALAAGQMGTRNLSGTVTDHQHEPLKGAVVEVENGVTLGVVSYITNRDGKYSFRRLDGDTDYRLWVTFRGRRSKVRHLSQFDSNRPKTINFALSLY
jgi:Carboxypeptidase regulatory-like domain